MPAKIKVEADETRIVKEIRLFDKRIAELKEELGELRKTREGKIEELLATIEDPQRVLPGLGGKGDGEEGGDDD